MSTINYKILYVYVRDDYGLENQITAKFKGKATEHYHIFFLMEL